MILLDGHSLTAKTAVPVVQMNLHLKERESTATMVPASMDGIGFNSWLLDDRDPGSGIVWRVRSIQHTYNTNTPQVQLEHVISLLKDKIMFGEITPATITGTTGATTCTAKQAIEYILGQQSDWTLGSFAEAYENISNPYKFNSDSLYAAMETVTGSLEDAWWTYDMSVYPFELNIVQHSDDVDSELRAGRNLQTVSKTIDRSGMFTRFYPIGKNNLHISSGYVEKNTASYGIVSKVETDMSLATEAELTAWANQELDRHAEPMVTVTADGFELSKATGEPLDALTIGRVCRIPLPEFDTTIQERIVEISWQDKVNKPESVKVTLANSRVDVTKIIAEEIRRGGGGRRAAAVKEQEDHAWFVDTDDHVAMVAEGIIGVDEQGNPDWGRLSTFIADGEGLKAKVDTTVNGMTDRISTLEINEGEIRADVAAAKSSLYSTIEQTATYISSEVSRKARVFVQETDPSSQPGVTLLKGDIWIQSAGVQNWNDLSNKSWTDAGQLDWNRYAGAPQFVWDGTRWEKIGDQGAVTEWGTKILQNDERITLLATAIGQIDPAAIASIDISADAITLAVSTAKSELYSVIRQTATNIVSLVNNDQTSMMSYVEQTASSITEAVARKNKVFVMMTDPTLVPANTVIDGDIWIQSVADDKINPTWNELNAKTWSSQSSTNWRDYYSSAWYVRKNNSWQRMRESADVVEIGTKLERDEEHIGLIARTVDQNHVELGSRLNVTAQEIRGEVHAAKSTLYSVISQTATQIRSEVANTVSGLSSSITQTASMVSLVVKQENGQNVVDAANIVAGINDQSGSYVKIQAAKINLSGYTTMTSFNALSGTVDGILSAATFGSNRITSSQINATGTLAASNNFNYKGHSIGVYACEAKNGATFYALGYS